MPVFRVFIPEQTVEIEAYDDNEARLVLDADGAIDISDIEEISETDEQPD